METNKELTRTGLIYVLLILQCILAFSLLRLKEHVEDIESRQYEVNEYILNRIGG